MTDKIVHLNDTNFDEAISGTHPILVDFWAEWCGPCKAIAPILEETAAEYEGKVTIAKLNVDQNPQTSAKFAIRSIPTLLLFKAGKVVATKVGALSKQHLAEFLEANR
jgi:thioredoxin 1